MSYLDILRNRLVIDEGIRNRVYPDTKGKMTLGVGHNIQDKPIRASVVELILSHDMEDAEADARSLIANFDTLSDVRKAVVMEMAFQLGLEGLSEFHETLPAIREGRWGDAADGMLASEVARVEAPARWARMAEMMRSDTNAT